MKTNKKVSICLAIFAIACAGAALAFMDWSKSDSNYLEHNTIKLYPILMATFMCILIGLTIKKKYKLVFLPLLGFIATGFYYVLKLYDGFNFNQAIFDIVSPSENFSVLTVLLFIGFIVSVFLSAIKDNKIAKYFVIGYLALIVASTIKFIPEIAINKDLFPYSFTVYSMVIGYLSLLVFFIPSKDEENTEPKKEFTEEKAESKKEFTEAEKISEEE